MAFAVGLLFVAYAGRAAASSPPYSNVGAREPGVIISDGQMCTFQYSGTPLTVADYAALPDAERFSWANVGSPVMAEVAFLSEIASIYGDCGGYGPGTDITQNVGVGTLAVVWDTQRDPGMAMCCSDLMMSADAQGASLTVSGIGTGSFGSTDERVLFDKMQSCAMGPADFVFPGKRLEGTGLQCSTTRPAAFGEMAGECILALLLVGLINTRRRS